MKKYIVLFIILTAILTIIKTPASYLQKYAPDFKFSGKIINGVALHKDIGLIKWDAQLLDLLLGKLSANVNIVKDKNHINSKVSVDIFQDIAIQNTDGNFDTKYLRNLKIAKMNFLNLANANIIIDNLSANITDKVKFIPEKLNANLRLKSVNVMGEKIGNYKLNAKIDSQNKIISVINEEKSAFKTNTKISIIANDVKINGEINAKNKNAKNLLSNFGIKNKLDYHFKNIL